MDSIVFVSGSNNEPMVSSRQVADKFSKEHKDVLRAYKNLVSQLPYDDFNERNFARVEYLDSKGETREEIQMTKDGFMLLALGFTGQEAIRWKIIFINAFNNAIGSVLELREELDRKEQVILQLQQSKRKRERRWLVPIYNEERLAGFPNEPRMSLKPQSEVKQPELNIAKYNHLKKTIEGIERQMLALKKEIGLI